MSNYVSPEQDIPPNPLPPADKFFTFIRNRGWYRTDSNWVGGVCAGIADRSGLDVILVRTVAGVLTLFTGWFTILYAVAWMLLPQKDTGRIHIQETMRGYTDPAVIFATILFLWGMLRTGLVWIVFGLGGAVSPIFPVYLFEILSPLLVAVLVIVIAVSIDRSKNIPAPGTSVPRTQTPAPAPHPTPYPHPAPYPTPGSVHPKPGATAFAASRYPAGQPARYSSPASNYRSSYWFTTPLAERNKAAYAAASQTHQMANPVDSAPNATKDTSESVPGPLDQDPPIKPEHPDPPTRPEHPDTPTPPEGTMPNPNNYNYNYAYPPRYAPVPVKPYMPRPPRVRTPGPGRTLSLTVLGVIFLSISALIISSRFYYIPEGTPIAVILGILALGVLICGLLGRKGGWLSVTGAFFSVLAVIALIFTIALPAPFKEVFSPDAWAIPGKYVNDWPKNEKTVYGAGSLEFDFTKPPADDDAENAYITLGAGEISFLVSAEYPVRIELEMGAGNIDLTTYTPWNTSGDIENYVVISERTSHVDDETGENTVVYEKYLSLQPEPRFGIGQTYSLDLEPPAASKKIRTIKVNLGVGYLSVTEAPPISH